MSVPKGTQEVLDFLAANKPISVAKEELPFSTVLREAILHVAITLHQDNLVLQKEVSNLKAKLGKQSAGMPSNTAGATTPVNAAGTPLNAAATSNAAGDSSPKPDQMPAGSASGASGELHMAAGFSGPVSLVADNKAKNPTSAESAREEKPPHERLCRSMWGYKECPRSNGEECERKHLSICDRPTCYGNVDARATCQERTGKWHGHIKAALVVQKKRERQEAKNRKQEAEKKDFLANRKEFLKWNKAQGNGGAPSARGNQQKNTPVVKHVQKRENTMKPGTQRRPPNRSLGDFFPQGSFPPLQSQGYPSFQPAPMPTNPAWPKPVNTPQAVLPGAREQLQDILKNLNMLLLQGVL